MTHSSYTFLQLWRQELEETNFLVNPFDLFYTEEREKEISKRTCILCNQDVTFVNNHECDSKENTKNN